MLSPCVLSDPHVRLEPLAPHHRAGLCDAIRDGELWKLHVTLVPHPDVIDAYLHTAEAMFRSGEGLAFATIDAVTGEVAGCTRFFRYSAQHRRVEIGYTFLGARWQKTRVNTAAKRLMLAHAFETLELNRVEFATDYLNFASRAALLRLGAKEEGILRNHMVMPDGRIRDSVLFSIIRHEWPGVKLHLGHRLA